MQPPPHYPQQPYYPQQAGMFPPAQPPKKKSRKPLLIGCGGAIVLLLIIIIIAAIATSNNPSQATGSATPTRPPQATKTPTSVPTSAPTTAPASSNIAPTNGRPALGGPVSDFVGKFGQPNDHSMAGQYHFLRVPGQALDGLIIATSPDNGKVDDITVATIDPGWTESDAENHCLAYAPLDYHFKQKIPYADNSGYDVVYSSASLAKAFPASDFTDGNSNQVTPGLFDIGYLYASDNQHVGSCDLIVGEQQTNN